MSNPTIENFFDNTGGGVGAPSASLKQVNDFVTGEVVDQAIVEKKKFGTDEVEKDARTGEPIMQLVVILQTDLRGWQGVAKIPTNEDGTPKQPSEDDGRRAIYVAPFTNIHAAIGDAVKAGTGSKGHVLNGGTLGVKIAELKDTGKGNPLKIHAAVYQPPAQSAGFFGDQNTAAPAQQAAPAPQAPPAAPAPQAPAPQAAPAAQPMQDPWANQSAPAAPSSTPPF